MDVLRAVDAFEGLRDGGDAMLTHHAIDGDVLVEGVGGWCIVTRSGDAFDLIVEVGDGLDKSLIAHRWWYVEIGTLAVEINMDVLCAVDAFKGLRDGGDAMLTHHAVDGDVFVNGW